MSKHELTSLMSKQNWWISCSNKLNKLHVQTKVDELYDQYVLTSYTFKQDWWVSCPNNSWWVKCSNKSNWVLCLNKSGWVSCLNNIHKFHGQTKFDEFNVQIKLMSFMFKQDR